MDTTIVNPTKGMKKIKLDKLKGEPIPVNVYGPMMAPEHNIKFGTVLKRKADQAVEKEKAKLKEKARESVNKRKDETKEKAKEKLKEKSQKAMDKLKKKFKF